jgi:hypothetical protein
MNTVVEILAWMLALGAVLFSIRFLHKGETLKAFQSLCCASALVIVAIVVLHSADLTFEKIVCWAFAGVFSYLSFRFLEKDKGAEAFVVFAVSVACLFAGFSSVQALLRTELISIFVKDIKSYGEKVDEFQVTLARMQSDTLTNQDELRILQKDIVKQQDGAKRSYNDISKLQRELATAQSNSALQYRTNLALQKNLEAFAIILERQTLSNETMQLNLDAAQTRLQTQEQQIGDVQHTVAHVFDNMKEVGLNTSDSNKVAFVHLGKDTVLAGFILPDMPVSHSIEAWRQGPNLSTTSLLPTTIGQGNCTIMIFVTGRMDSFKDNEFTFRYVKDTVNSNVLYQSISAISNRLFVDTNLIPLPFTNYGSTN